MQTVRRYPNDAGKSWNECLNKHIYLLRMLSVHSAVTFLEKSLVKKKKRMKTWTNWLSESARRSIAYPSARCSFLAPLSHYWKCCFYFALFSLPVPKTEVFCASPEDCAPGEGLRCMGEKVISLAPNEGAVLFMKAPFQAHLTSEAPRESSRTLEG